MLYAVYVDQNYRFIFHIFYGFWTHVHTAYAMEKHFFKLPISISKIQSVKKHLVVKKKFFFFSKYLALNIEKRTFFIFTLGNFFFFGFLLEFLTLFSQQLQQVKYGEREIINVSF